MKEEKIMDAIGGISDRHIEEFAVVEPVIKRSTIWKRGLLVAGLALVLLWKQYSIYVPTNGFEQEECGKEIWNSAANNDEVAMYIEQSTMGTIIITESLETAIEEEDGDGVCFVILVTETTGKSREYIYESFVKNLKKLPGNWDYMEKGIVYLEKEQIQSLECPPDLGLILSLASENTK